VVVPERWANEQTNVRLNGEAVVYSVRAEHAAIHPQPHFKNLTSESEPGQN
jgi:hypothetical protein